MALSGKRKAAILLTGLDPGTAGELLKSVPAETITEIAAELAYLGGGGAGQSEDLAEPIQEFFTMLAGKGGEAEPDGFVREMLESAVGRDRSEEVLGQVHQLVQARDPFMNIRSASPREIAQALVGESAQVAALVLSELPPKRSSELLGLLEEPVRPEAVRGMAAGQEASPETRLQVANVVQKRLDEFAESAEPVAGPAEDRKGKQLRKVAVLLRGLKKEARDELISGLSEKDQEMGTSVQELMVIWEDLPLVADRALQEVLRMVDSRSLALALVDAKPAVTDKVRRNISERANSTLDEEASLLSEPKPEEIEEAREEILRSLRALNDQGELKFEES